MAKNREKKPNKKKGLPYLLWSAALFIAYAAIYPKIAERLSYRMSDLITGRR